MNNFKYHEKSYLLYLRARSLAEACNSVYQAMSREEDATYYLRGTQEYLDDTQAMLDEIKGEIK